MPTNFVLVLSSLRITVGTAVLYTITRCPREPPIVFMYLYTRVCAEVKVEISDVSQRHFLENVNCFYLQTRIVKHKVLYSFISHINVNSRWYCHNIIFSCHWSINKLLEKKVTKETNETNKYKKVFFIFLVQLDIVDLFFLFLRIWPKWLIKIYSKFKKQF